MGISEVKTVFGPGLGGPTENYRIPSIVVTKSGVLVACCDARKFTGKDNPNRIDKVVRRSTDSGETWGEFVTIVEEQGNSQMKASAAIDPVMVYVEEINRIYMMYSHTPAGVGILSCDRTKGEDDYGNKIIKKGLKKFILKDGKLIDKKGRVTPYIVDENGNLSENGKEICNINIGDPFKEVNTSTLMLCHSDDDGLSWSKPVSINKFVKSNKMGFIGAGPGVGIVIKNGKYKGRILLPMYYGTLKFPLRLSCAVIYSDDMGETWKLGESPNNTRMIGRHKANDMRVTQSQMLTESQVIEQEDGTLKYFMRNHDKRRRVAVAYSKNGGESWEDFKWDDNLPQPICQMSVINTYSYDKPYVVFLNPSSERTRAEGVIRLSEDMGETFPYSRVLKEGPFVYSSIAELPDGSIGAFYEPDLECKNIDFVKVSIDWIKGLED